METVVNREDVIVISTDLPEVCPLLEANLNDVSSHALRVRPLAWGNEAHVSKIATEHGFLNAELGPKQRGSRLSHIVCSDLVSTSYIYSELC